MRTNFIGSGWSPVTKITGCLPVLLYPIVIVAYLASLIFFFSVFFSTLTINQTIIFVLKSNHVENKQRTTNFFLESQILLFFL